jgi:hypothetical protein
MSYVGKKYHAQGLDVGALLKKGEEYLKTAGPTLEAAKLILEDPALPQVTKRVIALHKLEQVPGKPAVKGVGLKRVVPLLGAYYMTRVHKWILPVGIAAVLGLPFLLGYGLGRKRTRR